MCRSYRPTIPVTYVAEILGFTTITPTNDDIVEKDSEGLEECIEWLKLHGACLIADNNGEMQLDAKVCFDCMFFVHMDTVKNHSSKCVLWSCVMLHEPCGSSNEDVAFLKIVVAILYLDSTLTRCISLMCSLLLLVFTCQRLMLCPMEMPISLLMIFSHGHPHSQFVCIQFNLRIESRGRS